MFNLINKMQLRLWAACFVGLFFVFGLYSQDTEYEAESENLEIPDKSNEESTAEGSTQEQPEVGSSDDKESIPSEDSENEESTGEGSAQEEPAVGSSDDKESILGEGSVAEDSTGEGPTQEEPAVESSDEKAPGFVSFYSDGNVTFARSTAKIKLSSSDGASKLEKIEYKIDDSEYALYGGPISISGEGQHRISYRAFDIVGNREYENGVTLVVDDTPPSLSTSSNVSFIKDQNTFYAPGISTAGYSDLSQEKTEGNIPLFYIRAIDQYSGVNSIEYSIATSGEATENQKYETYKGPISIQEPGERTIFYRATDNLGNTTDTQKITIFTDAKPPTLKISFEKSLVENEEKKYSLKHNRVILEGNDGESGLSIIMIRFAGSEEFQPYFGPIPLSQEGELTIEAKCIDKAGNVSPVITERIIIDVEPPQTNLEFISE